MERSRLLEDARRPEGLQPFIVDCAFAEDGDGEFFRAALCGEVKAVRFHRIDPTVFDVEKSFHLLEGVLHQIGNIDRAVHRFGDRLQGEQFLLLLFVQSAVGDR